MSLLELILLLIALLIAIFAPVPLLWALVIWLVVIIVLRVASPYLTRTPAA